MKRSEYFLFVSKSYLLNFVFMCWLSARSGFGSVELLWPSNCTLPLSLSLSLSPLSPHSFFFFSVIVLLPTEYLILKPEQPFFPPSPFFVCLFSRLLLLVCFEYLTIISISIFSTWKNTKTSHITNLKVFLCVNNFSIINLSSYNYTFVTSNYLSLDNTVAIENYLKTLSPMIKYWIQLLF